MEDEGFYHDDEEEGCCIPSWKRNPLGFRNYGRVQEQVVLALIEAHLPSDVLSWNFVGDETWLFRFLELDVRIATAASSACFLLPVELVDRNYVLERTFIDPVRTTVRAIVNSDGPRLTTFYELAILILRILEETNSSLHVWRGDVGLRPSGQGWQAGEVKSWEEVLDNPVGVDLSSVAYTAHYILGMTPEEICVDIPAQYRILHVESVLRSDLADRFLTCRAQLRQVLRQRPSSELALSIPHAKRVKMKTHEEMVEYLTTPRLTFHGTQRHAVHSIVRFGFTEPGGKIGDSGVKLSVRCGSTYGRGVYSSPSPGFSLAYSGYYATPTKTIEIYSLKLIVCATLMGRTAGVYREDNWRQQSEPMPQADSHVANMNHEYIVFDEAQIVPCYIVHLDLGSEHARKLLERIPLDPSAWVQQQKKKIHPKLKPQLKFPGDVEREKDAKKTAVLKWFPYGFGAATGTSFVIEEIGEVSDDEENYGEYQDAKTAKLTQQHLAHVAHAKRNREINMGKTTIFDEFYEAANQNTELE